jgi:hypothetical protein
LIKWEEKEVLICLFRYYGTPRKFRCSLISKTDLRVESSENSDKTVNKKHNKRLLSTESSIEPQGSKNCIKKRNHKIDDEDEDVDDDDDELNLFNQTQAQTQHQSFSRNTKNLTISISNTPTDSIVKESTELPKELTLSELYKLGEKDQYPRKAFIFDGKINYLTPVTHFFTTKSRVFNKKPNDAIEFTCKLDNCHLIHCKFGELTNLNHHLYIHKPSREWYNKYKNRNKKDCASKLTDGQLDIIKLFVSTYQSLSMISNEYFRRLINNTVEIPCLYYFRYDFLQMVIEHLHDEITIILNDALIVTLIPDIWEKHLIHRLGLGTIVTSASFERQLLVIGIEIIEGSNAVEVKKVTESIVNKYQFDKNKVKGFS